MGNCTDCTKRTATGGRAMRPEAGATERYEVRDRAGTVLSPPFRSATAAAVFARGHPGSTIHDRTRDSVPAH